MSTKARLPCGCYRSYFPVARSASKALYVRYHDDDRLNHEPISLLVIQHSTHYEDIDYCPILAIAYDEPLKSPALYLSQRSLLKPTIDRPTNSAASG